MMHQIARNALSVLVATTALALPASAIADPLPATTSLQQHTVVKWKKGKYGGKDRANFSIPGIGSGEVVCRPDATHIRIYPRDLTRETSMWSVVQQVKNGGPSWAVKNARLFTFATPTTPLIATGTGNSAQEGFNVENDMEDSATGFMYGLISQRTAMNQPGGQTAPTTSFTLKWKWSGFDGDASKQRCKVEALFFTKMPAGKTIKTKKRGGTTRSPGLAVSEIAVDWHGEADAALGKTGATPVQLPYLGVLDATCPTGRDSAAALLITADDPSAGLDAIVEHFEGEGPDATSRLTYATDPLTGVLRIPLPTNGFLRVYVSGEDGHGTAITVSSWRQTNDEKPAENFCEIAAQATSPSGTSGDDDQIGPT